MNKSQYEKSRNSSKDGQAPAATGWGRRYPRMILFLFLTVACGVLGVVWIGNAQGRKSNVPQALSAAQEPASGPNAADSSVFTVAHRSAGEIIRDFLDIYPASVQPIAFNHKVHLAKGMKCDICHSSVAQGPDAGIPSVKFCMACHQVIATGNPEIKKVAAYAAKGQDIPWQRVYWFYPSAAVRFWHAPHIRAGVDCSTCHGDMSQQTVAVRAKNITMHFCLNCHRERQVSVDCTTCHY